MRHASRKLLGSALAVVLLGAPLAAEGPVFVELGAGASASISGFMAGIAADAMWKPGLLGAGGGVTALVGMGAPDLYLVARARLDLGWFRLTAGPGFLVYDAPAPEGYIETHLEDAILPYLGLGLGIPVDRARVGVGLDFLLAEVYAKPSGNVLGDIFGPLFLALLGSLRLEASLSYRF